MARQWSLPRQSCWLRTYWNRATRHVGGRACSGLCFFLGLAGPSSFPARRVRLKHTIAVRRRLGLENTVPVGRRLVHIGCRTRLNAHGARGGAERGQLRRGLMRRWGLCWRLVQDGRGHRGHSFRCLVCQEVAGGLALLQVGHARLPGQIQLYIQHGRRRAHALVHISAYGSESYVGELRAHREAAKGFLPPGSCIENQSACKLYVLMKATS